MIQFWKDMASGKRLSYGTTMTILCIAKRIFFLFGYLLLSRLVLNLSSKHVFKSDVRFDWALFNLATS